MERGQWTPERRGVVAASFLGWALDAFDFFLLVFVIKDVAAEFQVDKKTVAWAIVLTLALRPIGAFLFGRLADKFGRRPILQLDIALYSILGFATAFAPNLTAFLLVRGLFGIAMGGEWGIGTSLAMESIPANARGWVSGLLQSGYPTGYLLASASYAWLYPHLGWRGMFTLSLLPALLVFFIRRNTRESPTWRASDVSWRATWRTLRVHWRTVIYAVVLMTAFNFFSHGTQDLYPTFLQTQHGLDAHATGSIAIIYNIGAILGGWLFGALSQRFTRRSAIVAAALLSLPTVYLWAFSSTAFLLAMGAFLMQFCVQGAWGVVPAHLNELSPPDARGTFPGTVYQLGNFIASSNAVLQTSIAQSHGGNYSLAMASVVICAALSIAAIAGLAPEQRNALEPKD